MGPKTYLGDSVYAEEGSFKGEVILTTDNGFADDPQNRIVLGPNELDTLSLWLGTRGLAHDRDLPVVGPCDPGVPSDVATPTEKDQTDDGS